MFATLQKQQSHSAAYAQALDLFSSNHPINHETKSINLVAKPKRIDSQPSNEQSFQAKTTKFNPLPQLFNDNNFQLQQPTSCKSAHSSFLQTLKNLPRKIHGPTNIKVLLKTQYSVIHNLIHKYFNYKFYNKEDQSNDIYLIWVDTYVSEEFIKRLRSYQKINHFPNSCELGRKDLLAVNLNRAKASMPELYKFYPTTWVLPQDFDSFSHRTSNSIYIIKPHANCQGRGIYLTKHPALTSKDQVIVQEYIPNPMLFDGCKFDLRVYVMVRSLDPLRIYVYEEGLCRLATSKYEYPNESNIRDDKMHLTNYAINKYAPNFIGNKDIQNDNKGHKRSLSSAMKTLQAMGFDTTKIKQRIDSIIIRSILSAYTKMLQSYKKTRESNVNFKNLKEFINYKEQAHKYFMTDNTQEQSVCFQLLGFDIILLDTGQPILLQINHQPSLVTDSPLDLNIKRCLIMDTINLLSLDEKSKEMWQKCQEQGSALKGSHMEEKELELAGGYRRIYPLNHIKLHQKTQEEAEDIRKHIELYEGIINRMMFRQFKRLSKLKMANYKTVASRNNNRTFLGKTKGEGNRTNLSAARTDKQSESTKKSVALTFYNLFNNSKYHITRGSNNPLDSQSSIEQKIIRNHILLQSIDKESNIKHLQGGLVDLKPKSRREDFYLRKQEAIASKMTDFFNDKSIKNAEPITASLNTNINNKNIIHYVSTNRSKTNIMANNYNSSLKAKPNSNPEQLTHKQAETEKSISSQKRMQYKQIYKNSIREKMQKINNLKILKNHLHKLNFINFVSKAKKAQSQQAASIESTLLSKQ